jgi:hypothetical protein
MAKFPMSFSCLDVGAFWAAKKANNAAPVLDGLRGVSALSNETKNYWEKSLAILNFIMSRDSNLFPLCV